MIQKMLHLNNYHHCIFFLAIHRYIGSELFVWPLWIELTFWLEILTFFVLGFPSQSDEGLNRSESEM